MDRETGEIVNKENGIAEFTKMSAWRDIKDAFVTKVVELNDLGGLSVDIDKLPQEIQARRYATEILMEWFAEIEGSNSTSEQNAEVLKDKQKNSIYKVLDD